MSIHPAYADRILCGQKRVEFRRRPLGRHVTHIVIYSTAPVSAVVGVTEIERFEQAAPTALWRAFGAVGGIERRDFFEYFGGVHEGTAYVLGRPQVCGTPLPLGTEGLPERPPQAFQYLSTKTLDAVLSKAAPTVGVMRAAG